MRRKPLIAIILTTSLLVSLTACGSKPGTPETPTGTTSPTIAGADATPAEPTAPAVYVVPAENTVSAYDSVHADYKLQIDASNRLHDISDLLMGIFFEDINFAADGGLYAEKLINRSFEFTTLATKDQMHGWQTVGTVNARVSVNNPAGALNENNTNYLIMTNTSGEAAGVANVGFLDGLSIVEGETYDFSLYARHIQEYSGNITVNLVVDKDVVATSTITGLSKEWKKFETTLTSSVTAHKKVTLQVLMEDGSIAIDMVSLFPQNTYNNRKNGLRADLAEMLQELEPSFLRFPGGCIIEGYNYETMYNWKDSIGVGRDGEPLLFNGVYGDVAARKQGINLWTNINTQNDAYPSFMTYGLGFYEYFLLAEDLGAIGVPVVNCGLYCQARGSAPVPLGTEEFQGFIQDALDLVEFCRGGADTKWGAVRISMGHEEPFELKYIGIGNENYGDNYYKRYALFVKAFEEAALQNPELFAGIELLYSSGLDDATSGAENYKSYVNAEKWLLTNPGKTVPDYAGAIDQHYYNTPEWFLQNTDYYDEKNYSRDSLTDTLHGGSIPVFVGEYAAKSNTLKAALAEAAYMTGIERNGDIIRMAAYAPLFGNLTATHWAPDLIWYNNRLCTGSINYYMQKLFSTNVGTHVLSSSLEGAEIETAPPSGQVGVGTWNTAAEFDNIKVVSNDTGEILGEQTFDENTFSAEWTKTFDSKFTVKDGKLRQTATTTVSTVTGTAAYYGNSDWHNYTYTLEATKMSGAEGFIIPFVVQSQNEQYFWNIGGWNNTVSCLQQVSAGSKTDQIAGTVKDCFVKAGRPYQLKIVVTDTNVKCYIDDKLYIDYDFAASVSYEAYQVTSIDENGDILIKLVNVTGEDRTFAIDLTNAPVLNTDMIVHQVMGDSLANDNILGAVEDCIMEEFNVTGACAKFNYTVPQYSATVLRIKPAN